MIRGHDLLVFAPGPWDDIWRNRHQLLTLLARENRVLWVERRIFLRTALCQAHRGELPWRRFSCPRVEAVRPNLYIYRDPITPQGRNSPSLGSFDSLDQGTVNTGGYVPSADERPHFVVFSGPGSKMPLGATTRASSFIT